MGARAGASVTLFETATVVREGARMLTAHSPAPFLPRTGARIAAAVPAGLSPAIGWPRVRPCRCSGRQVRNQFRQPLPQRRVTLRISGHWKHGFSWYNIWVIQQLYPRLLNDLLGRISTSFWLQRNRQDCSESFLADRDISRWKQSLNSAPKQYQDSKKWREQYQQIGEISTFDLPRAASRNADETLGAEQSGRNLHRSALHPSLSSACGLPGAFSPPSVSSTGARQPCSYILFYYTRKSTRSVRWEADWFNMTSITRISSLPYRISTFFVNQSELNWAKKR